MSLTGCVLFVWSLFGFGARMWMMKSCPQLATHCCWREHRVVFRILPYLWRFSIPAARVLHDHETTCRCDPLRCNTEASVGKLSPWAWTTGGFKGQEKWKRIIQQQRDIETPCLLRNATQGRTDYPDHSSAASGWRLEIFRVTFAVE